ncbi:MAG: cystathionine beta-lyase [Alphaproteobacteria bacterium]|nr:cystathionine beta-lyase [Alphaproteobacteria bacterium]MDE2336895.1 cystathionine beta-lyase [Alphaproteobacteria bacterium]
MTNPQKTGTLLTHISTDPQKYDGAVNIPLHRASTIVFNSYADFEGRPKPPFVYGRAGTPTSAAFEQAVAALEGAAGSVSTCSGLSAIVTAITAFAGSGDHVLIPDNAYGPNRKFCEKMLSHCGVEVEFYAPLTQDIGKQFRKNTKVLFIEAPGSLTFEVCDIGAFVTAAKAANITVIMDNSWASPLLFRPLDHGIDVSVMSCTKYISGHSDAMLGVVSATEAAYPKVKATALALGICAGSEELYIGLRGLRTLHIRLKEHQERGLEIARWLEKRPEVKRVLHPALASCPGHENWKKYFKGSCATFSFILHETDKKKFARMLDGFQLFHMGASWGGYESLCFPEQPASCRTATPWTEEGLLLRLHVGFEDIDDLKKDLEQGFKRLLS